MVKSEQLIREMKRKFILYSALGVLLFSVISFFAYETHRRVIDQQSSIQKAYTFVGNQINLVNKISILSEKFDDFVEVKDYIILQNEFQRLIKQLDSENEKFNLWLSNAEFSEVKNFEDLLLRNDIDSKMLLFMKRARELVNDNNLSNTDIRNNIRYLSDSSREGLVDVLAFIGMKIQKIQADSMSDLHNMGITLVSLCVAQLVLIWLLVFRPLYATIVHQHEKISDALLKAESANRSKTDFLANISHEIRTPMTAILGYADILKREKVSPQDREDAIRIIDQNANHLIGLIDEILDISKIEAGRFDFEEIETDLPTFLNEIHSLINVKAQEKGIDLIFDNVGRIPKKILTDPKRLKQIIYNILGNAIKFTSEGFVRLEVSFDTRNKTLSIKVRDTGIGISKSQIKELFRPFQQADTSVARKFGGTGLGLVLSRGLARAMGGDVKILSSKPGVGTTVGVTIEAGVINDSDFITNFSTNIIIQENPEINKCELLNKKILVVDDAKENARLFAMYLDQAGADVTVAHEGQTAIDLAMKNFFDIVLLDLQMPEKDGFTVIKELRENEFDRPIVALTAHAMQEEKDKTAKAGFNAHITKPVKPDFLIEQISSLIGGHQ